MANTNSEHSDNNIQLKTHLNDHYSDVTIIFQDGKRQISMNLHRIVLAWQIPYFDRLFSFADNLSIKDFVVQVDDATIAELLILSFYGKPVVWSASADQLLQVIKLKSFFCLDVDIHMKDLCRVKVPAEHFTLFLQVITLPEIEIDKRLLQTIRRNVPVDYSWEGVNEEFKQMVLDKRVFYNKHMISASGDNTLKLWDLDTADYFGAPCVAKSEIERVAKSEIERVAKSEIERVAVQTYIGHTGDVRSVVLTEDNQRIISASADKTLKLWDLATGACLRTYTGHTGIVRSVVLTEDNQRMISASGDKTLKLWDVATGACFGGSETPSPQAVQTYTGHTCAVWSVVLTEDNQSMISASNDKTLKLWDVATGACLRTYTGHTSSVMSVVLTEDNQGMISASADKTLKLWDLATGACVRTYTGHTNWIRSVVLTEDNQRMISASYDETLKLWDLATEACLKTYTGHTRSVYSVVLTEDNQRMISASDDKTLKLWDVATGACLRTYTGHTDWVRSVVLTKDRD